MKKIAMILVLLGIMLVLVGCRTSVSTNTHGSTIEYLKKKNKHAYAIVNYQSFDYLVSEINKEYSDDSGLDKIDENRMRIRVVPAGGIITVKIFTDMSIDAIPHNYLFTVRGADGVILYKRSGDSWTHKCANFRYNKPGRVGVEIIKLDKKVKDNFKLSVNSKRLHCAVVIKVNQ